MTMSRRQLFIAAGLMGAGMFWHPGVAHADEVSWRDELLAYYLPDRAGSGFSVKELVSGPGSQLEVWELPGAGYLLVDAASQAMIEYSPTAVSPLHGYITGCTVLHNTDGDNRCGWIAATIVMRYWHARSGKTLIPAAHRSGTNIRAVSGSDFADLIRDGRSAKTWGLPVSQGMGYHAAERMGVKSSCWYNAFSINIDSALKAGRPVILFGHLPGAYEGSKGGGHAVVAYGKSKDGHNIVHYGYPDKPEIVLNAGILLSNTHFILS